MTPAEVAHHLDDEKTSLSIYGKGMVFASSISFCQQCEALYRDGDDEALVARQARWEETDPEDVDEMVRKPLKVLRAADLGAVAVDDLFPPGVTPLRAQGFTPVEELAGLACIGELWPADHRRDLPDTPPNREDCSPRGVFWLVRSPWEWISTADLIGTMMRWVDSGLPPEGGQIGLLIRDRVGRFLAFGEEKAHQIYDAH